MIVRQPPKDSTRHYRARRLAPQHGVARKVVFVPRRGQHIRHLKPGNANVGRSFGEMSVGDQPTMVAPTRHVQSSHGEAPKSELLETIHRRHGFVPMHVLPHGRRHAAPTDLEHNTVDNRRQRLLSEQRFKERKGLSGSYLRWGHNES